VTGQWFITYHAIQRMREMEVPRSEVIDCLNPRLREMDYRSHPIYGEGFRVAVRGRLAVVYHVGRREVKTVLWRGKESREDPSAPTSPGVER
jgi:hypothetical protein